MGEEETSGESVGSGPALAPGEGLSDGVGEGPTSALGEGLTSAPEEGLSDGVGEGLTSSLGGALTLWPGSGPLLWGGSASEGPQALKVKTSAAKNSAARRGIHLDMSKRTSFLGAYHAASAPGGRR